MHKRLLILGTRGVPAQYGGFETIAEELAPYLIQKGWRVTVYCQEDWNRTSTYETMWGRVRRVHIPVKQTGLLGDMIFGLKAALHARKQPTMALSLGTKNAVFSLLQKIRGKSTVFHFDGLNYQDKSLGFFTRQWLRLNRRAAHWLGYYFIADHPDIQQELQQDTPERLISLIPTGATAVMDASTAVLADFDLEPGKYSTVIALPTAGHSLLTIVQAFSLEPRAHTLVVLGNLDENNPYHQQVLAAASAEVLFVDAIYDPSTVRALRYHSYLYVHGHQFGGTNPSLVEALAAGNPVIAHDNSFNRWVTGPDSAVFFTDVISCATQFSELLAYPDRALAMKKAARLRHAEQFTLEHMLTTYEKRLYVINPYEPGADAQSEAEID